MKKHLDNPLLLPTIAYLVGTVSIFLNLNKTNTVLPFAIGTIWLFIEMVRKVMKDEKTD